MISPRAETQLTAMRTEIERYGQSVVACNALLVFVLRTEPVNAQFGHIFTMAEREGWSVEFRPDGTVRFAKLQATVDQVCEWPEAEPDFGQAS